MSQRGVTSPGIRHPWFASTMISRSAPTASRTASITGRSTRQSCEWSRSFKAPTPASTQVDGALRALLRRDELARRRIGADALALASKEAPQRVLVRAPTEVPDRDLQDPVAAVMEVDGLEDPVDVRVLGVGADEQALQQRLIRKGVAARVALDALVGAHDHDRRVLMRARHGIPRGRERRVERVAVDPRLDRGDSHQSPL